MQLAFALSLRGRKVWLLFFSSGSAKPVEINNRTINIFEVNTTMYTLVHITHYTQAADSQMEKNDRLDMNRLENRWNIQERCNNSKKVKIKALTDVNKRGRSQNSSHKFSDEH